MTLDAAFGIAVSVVGVGFVWLVGYGVGRHDEAKERDDRGHTG